VSDASYGSPPQAPRTPILTRLECWTATTSDQRTLANNPYGQAGDGECAGSARLLRPSISTDSRREKSRSKSGCIGEKSARASASATLNQNLDAGSAAGRVGYESASQFSREYNRLFGAPPQRDIKRMRLI
jgi:AraC-like DNA-binding protein